jgi:hypothetical protein
MKPRLQGWPTFNHCLIAGKYCNDAAAQPLLTAPPDRSRRVD